MSFRTQASSALIMRSCYCIWITVIRTSWIFNPINIKRGIIRILQIINMSVIRHRCLTTSILVLSRTWHILIVYTVRLFQNSIFFIHLAIGSNFGCSCLHIVDWLWSIWRRKQQLIFILQEWFLTDSMMVRFIWFNLFPCPNIVYVFLIFFRLKVKTTFQIISLTYSFFYLKLCSFWI